MFAFPKRALVTLGNGKTVEVVPPQCLDLAPAGILVVLDGRGQVVAAWSPAAWMGVKPLDVDLTAAATAEAAA